MVTRFFIIENMGWGGQMPSPFHCRLFDMEQIANFNFKVKDSGKKVITLCKNCPLKVLVYGRIVLTVP